MIDVTIIGTAALMPQSERALASVYLSCAGAAVLFDCGEGTQTAIRKAEVNPMKISLIALTHYHGDHIFGLPGLMQSLESMGRTQPLYITGPEGLRQALSPILTLAGIKSYPIELIDVPADGLELASVTGGKMTGARLFGFPTQHRVPSRGYVFTLERAGKFDPVKAKANGIPLELWSRLQQGETVEDKGRIFTPGDVLGEKRRGLKAVISGDTVPCEELTKAAENADLLISEATYPEDSQKELAAEHGHTCFYQAAETAKAAGVEKLVLTHYSQMITDPAEYLENAARIFENTVCGEDGMKLTLSFR